jgi:hypothetical protein
VEGARRGSGEAELKPQTKKNVQKTWRGVVQGYRISKFRWEKELRF